MILCLKLLKTHLFMKDEILYRIVWCNAFGGLGYSTKRYTEEEKQDAIKLMKELNATAHPDEQYFIEKKDDGEWKEFLNPYKG
jgi:hypothetical protein